MLYYFPLKGSRVNYKNKNWLFNQYIEQDKSILDISKEFGYCKKTISKYLKKFSIKKNKEQLNNRKRIKAKNTFLKKYNVQNPMYLKETQDKIKKTNLERYGCENPINNNIVKKKAVKTLYKKYKVLNAFSSKEIRDKIKKTNLEKYGAEWYTQSSEHKDKATKLYIDDKPIKDISKDLNIPYSSLIIWAKKYNDDKDKLSSLIKSWTPKSNCLENYVSKELNLEFFGKKFPIKICFLDQILKLVQILI